MKWKDFYKGLMKEIKDIDVEFDAMKENVGVGKTDSYPDKSKSQYPGKSVSPTTTNTAVNDPEVTSVAKTKFVNLATRKPRVSQRKIRQSIVRRRLTLIRTQPRRRSQKAIRN